MKQIIAVLLATLMSPFAHAEFSYGPGIFSHNINGTTTTEDSKKSMLGTNYFPLYLRYSTQAFWGDLRLAPYLAFTQLTTLLIKNETPDGSAKRNFALVSAPLIYPVGPIWFLSGGPGFMYYEIKGKGGTKVVNNGTGTSTFGVPSKTRTSQIFLLEIGTGWQLTDWRINIDLLFSGLSSSRLSQSFQASFTYSFGGRQW